MNRETKIGLLTGLFVIILVGVLLSEYLSGADRAPKQAVLADVGAEYRHRTLNQVGVPITDRETGHVLNNPMLPREDQLPIATATISPAVAPAVNPIAASGMDAENARQRAEKDRLAAIAAAQRQQQLALQQAQAQARQAQQPIQLAAADKPSMPPADVTYVPGEKSAVITPPSTPVAVAPVAQETKPAKSASVNYAIEKGDTLGKIATKFYGTQKGDAIARIVAANPETLPNGVKSGLVVGKTLVIPSADMPIATPAVAEAPAISVVPATPKVESTNGPVLPKVIPVGGSSEPTVAKVEKKAEPEKKAEAKAEKSKAHKDAVYTVEKGDNLGIIAKKVYGSSKPQFVKLILDANKGLKAENLKIGQELKIPEKPN